MIACRLCKFSSCENKLIFCCFDPPLPFPIVITTLCHQPLSCPSATGCNDVSELAEVVKLLTSFKHDELAKTPHRQSHLPQPRPSHRIPFLVWCLVRAGKTRVLVWQTTHGNRGGSLLTSLGVRVRLAAHALGFLFSSCG